MQKGKRGESGLQWSTGSRIVGFETQPEQGDIGPDTPQTCWLINDGIPICVATDKLRPCTAPELLAYQYMQGRYIKPSAISEGQAQQSFIDAREELPPLVADDDSDDDTSSRVKKKKRSSCKKKTPQSADAVSNAAAAARTISR